MTVPRVRQTASQGHKALLPKIIAGTGRGRSLLLGVSAGALFLSLSSNSAQAQLAQLRAAAGAAPPSAASSTPPAPVRPVNMQEALQRQQALQTRAQSLAAYIQSAQSAARASGNNFIPGASAVTDGISANGLQPIAPVLGLTTFLGQGANPGTVTPNTVPTSLAAANDPTGLNTWDGATAPVQSTSNGKTTVTINQTQTNALLSWINFNIGANTTLVFNQKNNGVSQPGWTVVNRVTNAVNPSIILGQIKADGTVVILNNAGVLFGPTAQINTNALIASTLELGYESIGKTKKGKTCGAGDVNDLCVYDASIQDRNLVFLQNGLLASSNNGRLLSVNLNDNNGNPYDNNAKIFPIIAQAPGQVVVYAGATITSGDGGFIILAGPTVANHGVLSATDGQVSLQAGYFVNAQVSSGAASSAKPNIRGLILSSIPDTFSTAGTLNDDDAGALPLLDPNGIPVPPNEEDGSVLNDGIIESRRGYLSLGAGYTGSVTNNGLLEATTSVSRDGMVSLIGGKVTLGGAADPNQASAIVILPDDDGETIPQGTPNDPPAFKTSQVLIENEYYDGNFLPSTFTMQPNALIFAPSAHVQIGFDAASNSNDQTAHYADPTTIYSLPVDAVTIDSGAEIYVAGMMGVDLSASNNTVKISPAKQNDLRDTPNYRPVSTDGSFTLNGDTLYVDASVSGVRTDGVAWTGSPLLDAGSYVSQIPVNAATLMTKGGTISIDVGPVDVASAILENQQAIAEGTPKPPLFNLSKLAKISIAQGAVLDISGGWVTYDAGLVQETRLISNTGQIVNIADADPNGSYVGIAGSFTSTQPRYGITQTFYNAALLGMQYSPAYDEGRDAGALEVVGPQISFNGTVHGDAFAGANQLAAGLTPSAKSTLAGDPRKLQYSTYQLPAGGLLRIGSFDGTSEVGSGQNITIYDGALGNAPSNPGELLLDANMLSNAGLSGLVLQTSGAVTFTGTNDKTLETAAQLTLTGASQLTLANGGVLEVDAGRTISFDGDIRIADGTIDARTYEFSTGTLLGGTCSGVCNNNLGILQVGNFQDAFDYVYVPTDISLDGNPFIDSDNIKLVYAPGSTVPHPFDINVNGVLDVSGRWVNDALNDPIPQGPAWTNGGSINLIVAPRAFVALGKPVSSSSNDGYQLTYVDDAGNLQTDTYSGLITGAADISGSLSVNPGALLDASAGGYVSPKGQLSLSAKGGNIALIDETTYASIGKSSYTPSTGLNFYYGQTVAFQPVPGLPASNAGIVSALIPATETSVVQIAPGTLRDFGFAGGGTFTLVSPDVAFGGGGDANATVIPFDFWQETGFATLDVTSYHSIIINDLFYDSNSQDHYQGDLSAFFDTTRFDIGDGQQINLSQSILPGLNQLDAATKAMLLNLPGGSKVSAVLTPAVPTVPWYQLAANLTLRGLTELDVEAGGQIIGAPQATLTIPKLYNAGEITLPGGIINQIATLPEALDVIYSYNGQMLTTQDSGIGLTDPALGGNGFDAIFGGPTKTLPNGDVEYDLNGQNAYGLKNLDGTFTKNDQIFSGPGYYINSGEGGNFNYIFGNEYFVYFLGKVGANQGILLTSGSKTNLSGEAIFNPNTPLGPGGMQFIFGKIINGGSISTAAAFNPQDETNSNNTNGGTTSTVFSPSLFTTPSYGMNIYDDLYFKSVNNNIEPILVQTAARQLIAQPGAIINISGASAMFDQLISVGAYAPSLQWSNAGSIALRSGGTLSGAIIDAHGGAPQATGGTLEWLNPTIEGHDDGSGAGNVAYADQIMNAGFSTLIADGGLKLDGVFTLNLGDSLLVRSASAIDNANFGFGGNAGVTIAATKGTDATISAPYINFFSRIGMVDPSLLTGGLSGNATVTFAAGALGMDVMGGVLFNRSIANLNLDSATDIRLIGVQDYGYYGGYVANIGQPPKTPGNSLDGMLLAIGNITFDAARVYTTTGTGNLQSVLQYTGNQSDLVAPVWTDTGIGNIADYSNGKSVITPFLIAALDPNSSITFLGDHINSAAPLSAGSYLQVQANKVVQDGFLAAPLGQIAFGSAGTPIKTLSFGADSITSVSAEGLNIPYGTTVDLTSYYFTPDGAGQLTSVPSGALGIYGDNITITKGAKVDGSGGGDVFAYEFASGTGGSRDVLSRFNDDAFSSNNYNPVTGIGYQYADERQVYAIVPAAEAAKIALYDPIYSADYNGSGTGPTNLYGVNAGMAVTLDGGNGIPAGQYVLMPAHYALLPGAYRVVQNNGVAAPAPGDTQTLLDGSIIMGGTYSTAGTGFSSSQRVSFTIESQATFLKYSNIKITSGTSYIEKAAAAADQVASRLPDDAARLIIDPLQSLDNQGTFDMAAGAGGRGSQVDILGNNIEINHSGVDANFSGVVLSDTSLAAFNANSLLIGGERQDNVDGTTNLTVTAKTITVAGDATIEVPELLLATTLGYDATTHKYDIPAFLDIEQGAKLIATSTLNDLRAGDYDVAGYGALFRLANGPQRLVNRTSAYTPQANATLQIQPATIEGQSLLLDTSQTFAISSSVSLAVQNLALGADKLSFGAGQTVDSALSAILATIDNVTLFANSAITFDPNTTLPFKNLTIDAPGIGLNGASGDVASVVIDAQDVRLQNTSTDQNTGCGQTGAPACTTAGNSLTINAAGSLTLGSGNFNTYGFDGGVNITAAKGSYYEGAGSLNLGHAALTLTTPFLIDRAAVLDPTQNSIVPSDAITPKGNYTIPVTPKYTFATSGAIDLIAPALANGASSPTPAGLRAPGARINFGTSTAPINSLTIDGVAITASAGVIDAESQGSITLKDAASLATPGYTRTYGDPSYSTTISAGGGTVNLVSLGGDIILPATSTISVDNGIGNAGWLNLLAADGSVMLAASLDPGVSGPRSASLTLDSDKEAFNLDSFATQYGQLFEGDLDIRTGTGDLSLSAGLKLRNSSVTLTADGGVLDIAGTIDTSGVNIAGLSAADAANAQVDGGNISLWGMNGVTLGATALLDTHTSGYAITDTRQASAGDVTIGIGDTASGNDYGAAIIIDPGARINVSATRTLFAQAHGWTGNRLVPETVLNPATLTNQTAYQFVAADLGGTVYLRAPVVSAHENLVNVALHGQIIGASSTEIEGYKTYDLNTLAQNPGITGVSSDGTTNGVKLDPAATGNNILTNYFDTNGVESIPYFIQNFSISAVDGSNLAGVRLRPGIDLSSAGNITLVNDWNLAAGTVDTAAALKGGALTLDTALGNDANGNPYYYVTPGQEGNLLANYTTFLYRVGGKASGEAGVFSLEAGGQLDIKASINDGFFNFGDQSNPDWINHQIGGASGGGQIDPALTITSCNQASVFTGCSNATGNNYVPYGYNPINGTLSDYENANQSGNLLAYDFLIIDFTSNGGLSSVPTTGGGKNYYGTYAPFSAAANAASTGGVGDPFGFGQLFPLLPSGQAIHSSNLRLVGGKGSEISANPLHVDRASKAGVTVEGETQYLVGSSGGAISLGPKLYIYDGIYYFTLNDLYNNLDTGDVKLLINGQNIWQDLNFGGDATADGEAITNFPAGGPCGNSTNCANGDTNYYNPNYVDAYTILNLQFSKYDHNQASIDFQKWVKQYDIQYHANLQYQNDGIPYNRTSGSTTPVIGVTGSFKDIISLLFVHENDVLNGFASQKSGYTSSITSSGSGSSPFSVAQGTAHVRTLVRSGDGSIAVAAAGNIDLSNDQYNQAKYGSSVILRNDADTLIPLSNPRGVDAYQVGGTAIYTAGVRISDQPEEAQIVGTDTTVAVAPGKGALLAIPAADTGQVPTFYALDAQAGVMSTGGGDVALDAGGDILARQDVWSGIGLHIGFDNLFQILNAVTPVDGHNLGGKIGDPTLIWEIGQVGQDTEIAIAPKYFTSGVGALGGGNIKINAGGDVSDLTVALAASTTTTNLKTSAANPVAMTFGRGDLLAHVGGDWLGGAIDVAHGNAIVSVAGNIAPTDIYYSTSLTPQALTVRLADADVALTAGGSITLDTISALAPNPVAFFDVTGININPFYNVSQNTYNSKNYNEDWGAGYTDNQNNFAGFYAPESRFSAIATGSLALSPTQVATSANLIAVSNAGFGMVLPPSVTLGALTSTMTFDNDVTNSGGGVVPVAYLLYPSRFGELRLFSAGDLDNTVFAMLDSQPSILPGEFTAAIGANSLAAHNGSSQGLTFDVPAVNPTTSEDALRLYHNEDLTHAADTQPVEIYAGASIVDSLFNMPKETQITAGLDITNMFFTGQNLSNQDTTLISAGRDITSTQAYGSTSQAVDPFPYVQGNDFTLGGPGGFVVEAGRNIGPFITSATIGGVSYPGGIQTVGNLYNPWLGTQGADLTVLFGLAHGADYTALRDTYLDPANFAGLDSALFVQTTDGFGNKHPDRSEQIYAPILAQWLRTYAPSAFTAIFGSNDFPDTVAGNAALATAAYGQSTALYQAFLRLPVLLQNRFLINDVYFNELKQVAIPTSPSYLKYYRGYLAVNTLFPAAWGYTNNLATYSIAPSTISADHPYGIPVRNIVNGQPEQATQIETGDADLRLATLQTSGGGALSIMGPGGNFLAGSIIRTSTQAASLYSILSDPYTFTGDGPYDAQQSGAQPIDAIPQGYEGVLTLDGGNINSFTDGNFIVNQSRVFTEAGGDITMWSSNGDLNAGQGPKTASSFPPITVNIDQDGYSQVDSAGSVSGAGIGAFRRNPGDPASSVTLIAPVGLVDAGDAGVRASGDVYVAAARVANADNFSVGGQVIGVPSLTKASSVSTPTEASSNTVAQIGKLANDNDNSGRQSIITVDLLGYVGGQPSCDDNAASDPDCRRRK